MDLPDRPDHTTKPGGLLFFPQMVTTTDDRGSSGPAPEQGRGFMMPTRQLHPKKGPRQTDTPRTRHRNARQLSIDLAHPPPRTPPSSRAPRGWSLRTCPPGRGEWVDRRKPTHCLPQRCGPRCARMSCSSSSLTARLTTRASTRSKRRSAPPKLDERCDLQSSRFDAQEDPSSVPVRSQQPSWGTSENPRSVEGRTGGPSADDAKSPTA